VAYFAQVGKEAVIIDYLRRSLLSY